VAQLGYEDAQQLLAAVQLVKVLPPETKGLLGGAINEKNIVGDVYGARC
jgi:hypothetical protein